MAQETRDLSSVMESNLDSISDFKSAKILASLDGQLKVIEGGNIAPNKLGVETTLADLASFSSTSICKSDGSFSSYNWWYSTDYLECVGKRKLFVSGSEFKDGDVIIPLVSFFDADKRFISGYHDGQDFTISVSVMVDVPENAVYFRAVNQKYTNLNPFVSENKGVVIACIGDSLTEGDYGSEPEGTAHVHPENYPYFMEKFIGCKVLNFGKSGYTPINYWDNKIKGINWSSISPDVVLIMLGTNWGLTDTIETDVEPFSNYEDFVHSNTGCYCKIIEYLFDVLGGKSQIILCSTPWVDDTRRPHNKIYSDQANIVIPKIAERYNLPMIDTRKIGLNKLNTNTLQPVDGLHFGKYGYSRLGTFIGSQVLSMLSFEN